jgi:MFS family permease
MPMTYLPALNESARLRYGTFFYLYFMQGIPSGFALTALANYLLHEGISSSGLGIFVSIVGFPWIIQFIWGPFIDRYQYSIIGHRKHWVVLTQAAAFMASLSLLFVTLFFGVRPSGAGLNSLHTHLRYQTIQGLFEILPGERDETQFETVTIFSPLSRQTPTGVV